MRSCLLFRVPNKIMGVNRFLLAKETSLRISGLVREFICAVFFFLHYKNRTMMKFNFANLLKAALIFGGATIALYGTNEIKKE